MLANAFRSDIDRLGPALAAVFAAVRRHGAADPFHPELRRVAMLLPRMLVTPLTVKAFRQLPKPRVRRVTGVDVLTLPPVSMPGFTARWAAVRPPARHCYGSTAAATSWATQR